jgi:hypothetical protein
MAPSTWLPVPETVEVQVEIRRTISALVNGGLAHVDRDDKRRFDTSCSTLLSSGLTSRANN